MISDGKQVPVLRACRVPDAAKPRRDWICCGTGRREKEKICLQNYKKVCSYFGAHDQTFGKNGKSKAIPLDKNMCKSYYKSASMVVDLRMLHKPLDLE